MLISACNSYSNNKNLIPDDVRTKCSMYRTGKDYFDYHKEEKKENKELEELKKDMKGGGKRISGYEDTINKVDEKVLYVI